MSPPARRPRRPVAVALLGAAVAAAVGVPRAVRAAEIPPEARRLLAAADPADRGRGLRMLAERMDADATAAVLPFLDDGDAGCRDYACWILLGRLRDAEGLRLLAERGSRAATRPGRLAAADALRATGRNEAVPGLLRLARDRDAGVREAALDGLAALAAPSDANAGAVVAGAVADPAPGPRAAAFAALAARGGDVAVALEPALADPDGGVRSSVVAAFAAAAPGRFAARFPELARDADWGVRLRAASAAAALRAAPPVEDLAALLDDPRLRVRDAAHDALRALSGLDLPPAAAEWLRWWEGARATWRASSRRVGGSPRESSARWHGLPFRSDAAFFVVDLSGSMAEPLSATDRRPRAEVARAEVGRTLGALGDGTMVDVMTFTLEPERCAGRLQTLGDAFRRRVDAWFARREPGRRGDLGAALLAALRDPDADTILLLSDGAPSAGEFLYRERILLRVREALRRRPVEIRCVAFGGRPADRRFLRDLAEASGGGYTER